MKVTHVLLGAAFLLPPGIAPAAYLALHVFGDSLSDSGNAYVLSEGIVPPSPPYAQRFADGPVAAETLAAGLGLELAPSVQGGTNYAVGGATSGQRNLGYETDDPVALPETMDNTGITAQVTDFLSAGSTLKPQSSLVMLWGGSNDLFLALAESTPLEAAIANAVDNITNSVLGLADAGATEFLVPNMPDLSVTPLGLAQDEAGQTALQTASLAFNSALAQTLTQLQLQLAPHIPGLNLMDLDVAGFQHEVLRDPTAFGLTNVTEACLDSWLPGKSCDGHMYFDAIHPTAATHALLGQRMLQRVPEPATLLLMGGPFLALIWSRRRHYSTLLLLRFKTPHALLVRRICNVIVLQTHKLKGDCHAKH